MEPWGTPTLAGYSCEDFPSKTTQNHILLRKEEINPNVPKSSIMLSKMIWDTPWYSDNFGKRTTEDENVVKQLIMMTMMIIVIQTTTLDSKQNKQPILKIIVLLLYCWVFQCGLSLKSKEHKIQWINRDFWKSLYFLRSPLFLKGNTQQKNL